MRLLELFCGTGSMGRAFAQLGFEVVSLDSDPEAGATHTCNVLDFYYMHYPPGHFDVVWASPPCTHYSRARTTGGPRDLEGSDRLVAKTLEIIAYFKPTCWAFENVGSGLLPKREIVQGLHCSYLTYCKYADAAFPKYRKLTAIWHNLPWTPIPVCCRASRCAHLVDGRHPVSAQRAPAKVGGVRRPTGSDKCSLRTLYSMPQPLCLEIASVCLQTCQDAQHGGLQLAAEPLDPWAAADLEGV